MTSAQGVIWDQNGPSAISPAAAAVVFSRANGTLGVQAPVWVDAKGGLVTRRAAVFDREIWIREPYRYPEWAFGQAAANERLIPLPYLLDARIEACGEPRLLLQEQRLWLDGCWSANRVLLETGAGRLFITRRFRLADDGARRITEEWELAAASDTREGRLKLSFPLCCPACAPDPGEAAPDPRRPESPPPAFRMTAAAFEEGVWTSRWQGPGAGGLEIVMAVAGPGAAGAEGPTSFALRPTADGGALETVVSLPRGGALFVRRTIALACTDGQGAAGCVRKRMSAAEDEDPALAAFDGAAQARLRGAERETAALAHNLSQLRAQAPRAPAGVPAKGLTGAGYAGHVFWDADVYMLPVYAALAPALAERMIRWRIGLLPQAMARVRTLDLDGALYPWRTISGEECSAYFPAGTAQVHLNAGIAYACEVYWRMTGDDALLIDALPMLLETARLWPAIGHFVDENRFTIPCVTGPDEYSALVDDNYYTNLMAAHHLAFLREALAHLRAHHPKAAARIARTHGLSHAEEEDFARIARALHLPRLSKPDIPAQDASFAARRPWPVRRKRRPLLLYYHPLEIYRHRILKQADLILAMVLRRQRFSRAEMAAAFRYYAPLTTHDSSLSAAAHAIIAAWIGDWQACRRHFEETLFIDIEDRHANTKDGLHMAALAGSWRVLAEGFAGFDPAAPTLSFAPRRPPWLAGYDLRLRWRGRLVAVTVEGRRVCYRLLEGAPLALRHGGASVHLAQTPITLATMPPREDQG